jgi:hypothetical protein
VDRKEIFLIRFEENTPENKYCCKKLLLSDFLQEIFRINHKFYESSQYDLNTENIEFGKNYFITVSQGKIFISFLSDLLEFIYYFEIKIKYFDFVLSERKIIRINNKKAETPLRAQIFKIKEEIISIGLCYENDQFEIILINRKLNLFKSISYLNLRIYFISFCEIA